MNYKKNKNVSAENNFDLLLIPFDKSFIYIKITKVPKWILKVHQNEYQPNTNTGHLNNSLLSVSQEIFQDINHFTKNAILTQL